MKKHVKKLVLAKETIRSMSETELRMPIIAGASQSGEMGFCDQMFSTPSFCAVAC
jgi:hypothetical protein